MMVNPQLFLSEHESDSYDQLIMLCDMLIVDIKTFENKQIPDAQRAICPSPEVIYQMNLLYLSALCSYIADRYNAEFVNCDDEGI